MAAAGRQSRGDNFTPAALAQLSLLNCSWPPTTNPVGTAKTTCESPTVAPTAAKVKVENVGDEQPLDLSVRHDGVGDISESQHQRHHSGGLSEDEDGNSESSELSTLRRPTINSTDDSEAVDLVDFCEREGKFVQAAMEKAAKLGASGSSDISSNHSGSSPVWSGAFGQRLLANGYSLLSPSDSLTDGKRSYEVNTVIHF